MEEDIRTLVQIFSCFSTFCIQGFKSCRQNSHCLSRRTLQIGIPFILFRLQEALGGVFYSDDTIKKLAQIEKVVVIKEATFDALKFRKMNPLLNSLPERISLLTGNDKFIIESFILGADGALIGFGSVFTDIQADAINLVVQSKYSKVLKKFEVLVELCDFCFGSPIRDYRIRIKHVLVQQKIFQKAYVQPSLQNLDKTEQKKLLEILSKMSP